MTEDLACKNTVECITGVISKTIMTKLAYAPVENNPKDAAKVPKGNPYHSATSGEMAIYRANNMILKKVRWSSYTRQAGVKVDGPVTQDWADMSCCTRAGYAIWLSRTTAQSSLGYELLHTGSMVVSCYDGITKFCISATSLFWVESNSCRDSHTLAYWSFFPAIFGSSVP
ncbi:hypothetical protein L1987_00832 [Smallanthus sonchifolius]|uniref:Uncharacterized protein n=1 Tax=Smallanthus sonchifolius TaxID=185202 RepID=A0ACB9K3F2_9ASTR|nr:hypothetical protein L1987_00832 [Smallanthus sonchifolius]